MIGIVCFWDRTATPYLQKYEDLLQAANTPYEILFWNRSGVARECSSGEIDILLKCHRHPLLKLVDFFRWSLRVRRLLKNRRYDKLIVLTTVPAILLADYLKRQYKERYILDIRDYTLEKNPLFYRMVTNLVRNSALTPISSDGFREWLEPSDKIVTNHNITWNDRATDNREYFATPPFRYTFVGNVRLDEQTRMVLLALKNHPQFRSGYVGRMMPECELEELCCCEGIENCDIRGEFHYTEKPEIYRQIDLINAIYANAPAGEMSPGDSTPIPNRLYDCVVFRVPIVCCKGTYLADIVEEFSLGFAVDAYLDDIVSCFEEYVASFDKEKFLAGCDAFLTIAQQEEASFKECVLNFIKEESR
ncbi:MAG: hypothetical protein IJC17_04015 [Clostridia bacterium]|nr:hypothetical protein [Clostridia bacterium]